MDLMGLRILNFYGLTEKYEFIGTLYNQYNAWAVGVAGFTPIPYKVFTISAGAFKINFPVFVVASLVSRSARFFLVGWLIFVYGSGIRSFIDRYFNILTVVFFILLIGGFILIKWIM